MKSGARGWRLESPFRSPLRRWNSFTPNGLPSGSGTGPDRALKANTKIPSRAARKPHPSAPSCELQTPGRGTRPTGGSPVKRCLAGKARSRGASPQPVAHPSVPNANPTRTQNPRRIINQRLPHPSSTTPHIANGSGSGTGPDRALKANTKIPSRAARKPHPSAPSCELQTPGRGTRPTGGSPVKRCLAGKARSRGANPGNAAQTSIDHRKARTGI